MSSFVGIDFETANAKRISPCSVGLVKVVDNVIVDAFYSLIDPETTEWTDIAFSIHGISPNDVKGWPNFSELWHEKMFPFIEGSDFLVGHNVNAVEKSIINQCSDRYNMGRPDIEYKCSMKLAKKVYNLKPAGLENVCNTFGFDIIHHNALHDALASARLVINFNKDKEVHKRFGQYDLSDEEKKIIDSHMFDLGGVVEDVSDAIKEELRMMQQHMDSIGEEIKMAKNSEKSEVSSEQVFDDDEINCF
jgi:DNA polymerase III subunit epsilon